MDEVKERALTVSGGRYSRQRKWQRPVSRNELGLSKKQQKAKVIRAEQVRELWEVESAGGGARR